MWPSGIIFLLMGLFDMNRNFLICGNLNVKGESHQEAPRERRDI
jgi:hypothetical protein